jgi:hypothetical protein
VTSVKTLKIVILVVWEENKLSTFFNKANGRFR